MASFPSIQSVEDIKSLSVPQLKRFLSDREVHIPRGSSSRTYLITKAISVYNSEVKALSESLDASFASPSPKKRLHVADSSFSEAKSSRTDQSSSVSELDSKTAAEHKKIRQNPADFTVKTLKKYLISMGVESAKGPLLKKDLVSLVKQNAPVAAQEKDAAPKAGRGKGKKALMSPSKQTSVTYLQSPSGKHRPTSARSETTLAPVKTASSGPGARKERPRRSSSVEREETNLTHSRSRRYKENVELDLKETPIRKPLGVRAAGQAQKSLYRKELRMKGKSGHSNNEADSSSYGEEEEWDIKKILDETEVQEGSRRYLPTERDVYSNLDPYVREQLKRMNDSVGSNLDLSLDNKSVLGKEGWRNSEAESPRPYGTNGSLAKKFFSLLVKLLALGSCLGILYLTFRALMETPKFCPTGLEPEDVPLPQEGMSTRALRYLGLLSPQYSCYKCPEHGACVDGELQCDTDYTRSGVHCVENSELTAEANKVVQSILHHLRLNLGQEKCARAGLFSPSSESPEDLKEHLVDYDKKVLKNPSFVKVLSKKSLDRTVRKMLVAKELARYDENNKLLVVVQKPLFSVYCLLKMNTKYVGGVFILFVALVWVKMRRRHSARVQKLVSGIYEELNRVNDNMLPLEYLRAGVWMHGDDKTWEEALDRLFEDSRLREVNCFVDGEDRDCVEVLSRVGNFSKSFEDDGSVWTPTKSGVINKDK